jgi:hypothetical protein
VSVPNFFSTPLSQWKLNASIVTTQFVTNPVKSGSTVETPQGSKTYPSTVTMKVSNAKDIVLGGVFDQAKQKVVQINWNHNEASPLVPIMSKSQYGGKDFPVARVFLALDPNFATYTDKYLGSDGKMRLASWGDITPRDKVVLNYRIKDLWKTKDAIVMSLEVVKALFYPTPKETKEEFKGKQVCEPTVEELAKLIGVASAESSAAAAEVPLFEDDEIEAADAAKPEPEERRESAEFNSPERTTSAAPPKTSKKRKTVVEDDE